MDFFKNLREGASEGLDEVENTMEIGKRVKGIVDTARGGESADRRRYAGQRQNVAGLSPDEPQADGEQVEISEAPERPSLDLLLYLAVISAVLFLPGIIISVICILLYLKARLLIMEKKYEQAAATQTVIYILFALSVVTGVMVYGAAGYFLARVLGESPGKDGDSA